MSAKKLPSRNYVSDYSLKDGYGVSTYPEMDHLFREYCREAANVSIDDSLQRKRSTKILSMQPPEGPKSPTIGKPQSPQHNTVVLVKRPSDQIPRDEANFRPKSSLKQNSPHQKSALSERKLTIHDLRLEPVRTEESQLIYDGPNREKDYQYIDSLKRSMSREFKELQKKHSVKQNQAKKFDKDFQKMKEKAENDKMDIFKWLNIKSDFDPLKKKLRARIMQAINHTDPEKISVALERISQSREDTTLNPDTTKVVLDNIPQSNNLEIMAKILNEDTSHFNPSPRRTQNKETFSSAVNSSPNDPLLPVQRSSSVAGELLERKTSLAENESKKNKKDKSYKWDDKKEDLFSSSRAEAKNRNTTEIKSSNWNQLGFFPLVQAFLVSDKSKPQRDAILAKYMNGDLLTAQEFKFIADTSASINACVDKKYLQKVVNNIDTEVIDAFELELAENILDEYKSIKNNIQNSRHRFLTEENEECVQRIEKREQKHYDRLKLELGKDEQRKTKQKIIKFLERKENKKNRKNKNAERNSVEPDSQNIRKIDIKKVINAPEFLRGFVPRPQSARTIDVKAAKHFYHPSSKIAITSRAQQPDFLGLPTHYKEFSYAETSKADVNDYKLHIKSPQSLKSKPKFRKFYSGGPSENLRDVYEGRNPDSDTSEVQNVVYDEKVVEKIQAVWKGKKQRKLFREMLERREERLKEIERRKLNNEELSDTTLNQADTKQYRIYKKSPSRKDTNLTDLYKHSSSMGNVFENNDYCLSPGYKRSPNHEQNNRDTMMSPRTKKVTLVISEKNFKTQTSFREMGQDIKSGCSSPTLQRTLQSLSKQKLPEERIINSARGYQSDQKVPKTVHSNLPFKDLMLKQRKIFSAVETNNLNLLLSLRLTEADVNSKDSYGNTPLFYAASNANKEIVEILTKCGAKVNERCSNGNTPMHKAFASGQLMMITFLLSRGGNLNILNDLRQPPTAFGSADLLNLLKLQDYNEVLEKKGPSKIKIPK